MPSGLMPRLKLNSFWPSETVLRDRMQRWANCTDEQPIIPNAIDIGGVLNRRSIMKPITVLVWYANGKKDWFRTFKMEEARAKFNEWKADWLSVHVVIE